MRAQKASGIDELLLDFFVDHVRSLHARADSSILLQHARELRAYLINKGFEESALPKLIGHTGHTWFLRGRRRHGIIFKKTGMRLKVAWRKVLKRVKVLMGNIFRLKALWELVHPGK